MLYLYVLLLRSLTTESTSAFKAISRSAKRRVNDSKRSRVIAFFLKLTFGSVLFRKLTYYQKPRGFKIICALLFIARIYNDSQLMIYHDLFLQHILENIAFSSSIR